MKINGIDIHEIVKIGQRMVNAHNETNSVQTAIDLYLEQYPEADQNMLAILWVGINCKDRQLVDG